MATSTAPNFPGIAASTALPGRRVAAEGRIEIGSGVQVKGSISRCAAISVQGGLQSEQIHCEVLDIAEGGHFAGSATAAKAEIWGKFQGRLIAAVLTIQSSAQVDADIQCGELQIERGARVSGTLTPMK